MKIWITEIGEPLPLEKDVRLHRVGMFSQYLAEQGNDVVWWTSSFSHAPKKHFADSDQDFKHGKAILRVLRGPGYQRNVSWARIRHQRHFSNRFYSEAGRYPKPDIIISPVPTIEVAESAMRFGTENKIPVMTDIRDLWPDEMRDLAPKPLRPLAQMLLWNSYRRLRYICSSAAGIMGVSQSYLDYGVKYSGRSPNVNDCVFPLGYSPTKIDDLKMQAARQWRREEGIRDDAFVICFFGTIGLFFDLETVIRAAKILQGELPLQVVIGGHGSRLEYYKQLAHKLSVNSVIFPGWLKAPEIAAVMEVSRAGLAPYNAEAKMSLPNKPFEYFSAGLPVISSIRGELKDLIEMHNCGVTYVADSVESLCEGVQKLHSDDGTRQKMGENARVLFQTQFTTEKIFARVHEHLSAVVKSYRKN